MRVSVLGCGRWGSFLAWYMHRLGNDVISFGPEDAPSYQVLKTTGANEYVTFPADIRVTCDLAQAVSHAEVIIVSISAQGLRGFLPKVVACGLADKKMILCMKGLEEPSGKRLSEVAVACGVNRDNLAVWVGPGHIQDFVKGIPNCMVIDSYRPALTRFLADSFRSDLIRFYYGNDIIGSEIGAATKNIMGIVAGMLDGVGYVSLKGPLMARGAREVSRLIGALGGNEHSAFGLCHLGDYETTLFSPHSHNRKWGELYARGEKFDRLAEGVPTASAVAKLAARLGVDMPITAAVDRMIRDAVPPLQVLSELFEREPKKEF